MNNKSEGIGGAPSSKSNLFYWIFHIFAGLFTSIIQRSEEGSKPQAMEFNESASLSNKPVHSYSQHLIANDISFLANVLNNQSKSFDISAFMLFMQNLNDILKKNELESFNYEFEINEVFAEIQNTMNNVTNECKEALLGNLQHIIYRINPKFLHNSVNPTIYAESNAHVLNPILRSDPNYDYSENINLNRESTWDLTYLVNPKQDQIRPDLVSLYFMNNSGINPQGKMNIIKTYNNLHQNKACSINDSYSHQMVEDYYVETNIYNRSSNESGVMTTEEVERYLGKKLIKDPFKHKSSNAHDKRTQKNKSPSKTINSMVGNALHNESLPKIHKNKKLEAKTHKFHSNHIRDHKKTGQKIIKESAKHHKANPQVHSSLIESKPINCFKFDEKYKEMMEFVENPRRKNEYSWIKDSKSYLKRSKLLIEEINEFKGIYSNELDECLKEECHVLMRKEFPSMYEVENFYENIFLVKKQKLKINQLVCDIKAKPSNEGPNILISNADMEKAIKDAANNISTPKHGFENIPIMKKMWEPSSMNEFLLQELLSNIENKFPREKFHWTQEVVLELLMKQNFDSNKLMSMLDDLNFKEAIEERASQSTDNIPFDEKLTKRLSLRRSTQTQHQG